MSAADDKTLKRLLAGVSRGNTGAMRQLALMYQHGDGVPQDPEKAFYYWYISDNPSSNPERDAAMAELAAQLPAARRLELEREGYDWITAFTR